MPFEVTKNYVRRRQRSPKSCAKGSFRTIKRGRTTIVVCCPKGKFTRGRCTVGTRAQSILTKR
jgi:hypothetical protein